MMQKLTFAFTLLLAGVFTFSYSTPPSGPANWSDLVMTYVTSFIIAAAVLAVELILIRALLQKRIDNGRKRRGDLNLRIVGTAMVISLLPALLIFLASSLVFDRWFQLPTAIAGDSREFIDEINRANLPRLQHLASETIVFSPDDSGEFSFRSIQAGADCVWVLDPNGKIEKGGSLEPSESSFNLRPDAFQFGQTAGTFVRSLSDGLELWSVNDRTCLAFRKPIQELATHIGDLVVGQYTAGGFAERYASLEAQNTAGNENRLPLSTFKHLPLSILVLFYILPFLTLTLCVVYIESLATDNFGRPSSDH